MGQHAATPPLAHNGDRTVYLLLDCQTDRQAVIADLISGQYRHPLRVVAFHTDDGRICDITSEIAREVLSCARELNGELLAGVREFVKRAGC
jgi:hypothetical protein